MDKWCILMYTVITFKYHPDILTTFNLTLNESKLVHMLGEKISDEGFIYLYNSESLTFMAKFN